MAGSVLESVLAGARAGAASARALRRRLARALENRHKSVTGGVIVEGAIQTRPVFVIFDMDHGQRLAEYQRKDTAVAALRRIREADPEAASTYGIRELRNGRAVGEYITDVDTVLSSRHN